MQVATQSDFERRKLDLDAQERDCNAEAEEARKNRNFTQTYPQGWQRVRELYKLSAGAGGLYTLLAEHIDATCGAVVADQKFLAKQLNCTTRSIRNYLNILEEQGALVRIPIAGRVCAYALNPHEVWKGYNNSKDYAAFTTKTLVNKDGEIKRRIMAMFHKEQNQPNSTGQ